MKQKKHKKCQFYNLCHQLKHKLQHYSYMLSFIFNNSKIMYSKFIIKIKIDSFIYFFFLVNVEGINTVESSKDIFERKLFW